MRLSGIGIYFGNVLVAYYGLCIVIGILVCVVLSWKQCKKFNLSFDDFGILASTCALTGITGAKLLYLMVSYREIDFKRLTDLKYINSLMQGGFVFFGGIIGMFLGLYICHKYARIEVRPYLDKLGMCIPILHGFGRIGCAMVGCCYGIPYEGVFSIVYKQSIFAPNNIALFPIQITEAIIELLIGIVLIIYINYFSGKNSFWIYLQTYSVVRFFIEFLRYDFAERGVFMGLSTSQYIAIILLGILSVMKKRNIFN